MTSTDILKANLLDIIFENRNKQYGAYILRKYYPSRLSLALILSLTISFLFFFLFQNTATGKIFHKSYDPDVVLQTVPIPKIIPPKPIQPHFHTSPPVIRTALNQFNNIRIVPNDKVTNPVPDISVFVNTNVSDHNQSGIVPLTSATSSTAGTSTQTATPEEKPFEAVERAPEFPGGMKAWVNFLSNNLEIPSQLEAGEKKTVMIRFKVATDGSVTGFEVVQSAGSIYDNEVIRVLKKMPKWKPAIQNGHIVATSFTQPVTFVGVEQ